MRARRTHTGRWVSFCFALAFVATLATVSLLALGQPQPHPAPPARASASAHAAPSIAPSGSAVAAPPGSAPVAPPASAPVSPPESAAPVDPPALPPPAAPKRIPPEPSSAPELPAPALTVSSPPPTPSATPRAPEPAPIPPATAKGAEVRLHDTVAFVIRTAYRGRSPERRAQDASKALSDAFTDASPDDVRVEIVSENDPGNSTPSQIAVVYVGKTPIVQLTPDDASAGKDVSLAVHADGVASGVREAIRAEKERSAVASRVFSISLVVFFFVVTIYLIRRIGEFADRANGWLRTHPDRIPAIRVRRLEVVNPAMLRSGLALTISVGKWLAQFGILYAWLIAALSLFESTRAYTTRLTGFIFEPFASLASRIATTLPIAMVAAIALIAIAILLRAVGLFFESVAASTTTLSWLAPDLARPTSALVRGGIVLVALVFFAPLITGNAEGALPRVGLVAIVALGLSSVPLLASGTLGAVAVFGRRVRVGEYVDFAGRIGKVVDVGLLDISIEDDEGTEIRFPHFLWLIRPVRLLGPAPRVSVKLSVERTKADAALRERLLLAIAPIGQDPRVEIDGVGPSTVDLFASVVTEDADAKSRLYLLALEALEPSSVPVDHVEIAP